MVTREGNEMNKLWYLETDSMGLLGMQLAADQVVTERPGGRMGFWDEVKRV